MCVLEQAEQIHEQISQTVFLGLKKLGGPLTHLSFLISLWEMLIDRNTISASPSSTPACGEHPCGKNSMERVGKNMAALAFAMNSCHPQLHTTWLGGSEQARASMSAKPGA